jgi:hypothetical protein
MTKLRVEIEKIYAGKLIHQFRKGKYPKSFKTKLENIIADYSDDVYDKGQADGYLRGKEYGVGLIKESYKGFVPKPSGSLKNRIKFLFLGKF